MNTNEVTKQAKALAIALHDKHYSEITHWRPASGLSELLLQIDNMTAELVRK